MWPALHAAEEHTVRLNTNDPGANGEHDDLHTTERRPRLLRIKRRFHWRSGAAIAAALTVVVLGPVVLFILNRALPVEDGDVLVAVGVGKLRRRE